MKMKVHALAAFLAAFVSGAPYASEAVTNAIIHGYGNVEGFQHSGFVQGKTQHIRKCHQGKVHIFCGIEKDVLWIEVRDEGVGILDIEQAMEPLFTTKPELNRSGMGFAFMEAFMDDLEVFSEPGEGTVVRMQKKCGSTPWIEQEE